MVRLLPDDNDEEKVITDDGHRHSSAAFPVDRIRNHEARGGMALLGSRRCTSV
jgi:hypothetical protein